MTRALLLLVALPLVASCQQSQPRRDAGLPLAPALRNFNPDAPRPRIPEIAEDAGPGMPVADVVTLDNGAVPAQTFEGPDTRVTIGTTGEVTVRATDLWDGGFEQTYESCAYVRNALVQLRRSLRAPSVEVLVRACGNARPGERVPVLRPAPPARPAGR